MILRPPLTVYFDGSCPLCTAEVSALKVHDRDDALQLVDCASPGFTDHHLQAAGIANADLLRMIHARDGDGRWLKGVDVFVAMYRIAGLHAIARLWAHPWLRPLWDRAYPWIARHRMALSRLGLERVYGWLVRRHLRKVTEAGCTAEGCRVEEQR